MHGAPLAMSVLLVAQVLPMSAKRSTSRRQWPSQDLPQAADYGPSPNPLKPVPVLPGKSSVGFLLFLVTGTAVACRPVSFDSTLSG